MESEVKINPKAVLIERAKLAHLIKLYAKSICMVRILTYICQDKKLDNLTFLKEEICELFDIEAGQLDEAREKGEIRYYENQDIIYYEMNDIVKFKTTLIMQNIYAQLGKESTSKDGGAVIIASENLQ